MHRIDRNVAQCQVLVEVLLRRDIPAAQLDPHLDVKDAVVADRRDVDIGVQDDHVGVHLDLAAVDLARLRDTKADRPGPLAMQLQRDLLQVQDDVRRVLYHAGDRAEFVRNALDPHRADRGAFNGAQQRTAQRIADGRAESPLERLGAEAAVRLHQGSCVHCQPLGLLETSPHT